MSRPTMLRLTFIRSCAADLIDADGSEPQTGIFTG